MNSDKPIRKQVSDNGICTISLDRPDNLNALNEDLLNHLWHEFETLGRNRDARAIILTGSGQKAFCVGADLKERRQMSEADTKNRIRMYRDCFRAVSRAPQPVIAAINGYAFGGGLEVALACDFRLVAEETKVGLTETKLGIIPGAGGTQRLPRLIGAARAKELIFTGARISGTRAAELGIARSAHPVDELMDEAISVAEKMLDSAPIAIQQAKYAIDRGLQTDLETGLELEAQAYNTTLGTQDRQEGLAAFKENRQPDFQGK